MDWLKSQWNEWARHVWRIAIFVGIVYGLHLAILIEHHGRVAAENSQWMRVEFQAAKESIAAETVALKQEVRQTKIDAYSVLSTLHARSVLLDRKLDALIVLGERFDAKASDPFGAILAALRNGRGGKTHQRMREGR